MKIETKTVQDSNGNTTVRWFAKTDDGFDGTAQGWGYKSKQKLMKAYWYFKNKHKINSLKSEAKRFLRENPKIRKILFTYFSADNILRAWKDGESLSFKTFMNDLNDDDWNIENKNEIMTVLSRNKHLWKTIEKEC